MCSSNACTVDMPQTSPSMTQQDITWAPDTGSALFKWFTVSSTAPSSPTTRGIFLSSNPRMPSVNLNTCISVSCTLQMPKRLRHLLHPRAVKGLEWRCLVKFWEADKELKAQASRAGCMILCPHCVSMFGQWQPSPSSQAQSAHGHIKASKTCC